MEGIRIEFEGGRAVKADADVGADALRATIAEGRRCRTARRARPRRQQRPDRAAPDTVFYDTLIDENAASHIALGNAYTFPVEDEADRERMNRSNVHVDFMIGCTSSTSTGITARRRRVPVLRGGSWQI